MSAVVVSGIRPVIPPRAGRFDLAEPLELLPDAWSDLRRLHEALPADAELAVRFGQGSAPMRPHVAVSLLKLAGFSTVSSSSSHILARRVSRESRPLSTSIVVPCRDEIGNVDGVVRRMPSLGAETELIFVDGASADGTPERIEQLAAEFPDQRVRLIRQRRPSGKASAVFEGFDAARGDVLVILDADMTVAPEDLERFYCALAEGRARFANGTRFVYPMASGAMPAANAIGNRVFSLLVSSFLHVPVTDTLCGTKALLRDDWLRLRAIRHLFGGHDRWGDFDLLLGAGYLGLDVVDVPVHYGARTAGESKMHAFRDGWQLARTCLEATWCWRRRSV